MAIMQDDMIVAEYHARFLTLERFTKWSFQIERQRASTFVFGLRVSLHTLVSMFSVRLLRGQLLGPWRGRPHTVSIMSVDHHGRVCSWSSEAKTP